MQIKKRTTSNLGLLLVTYLARISLGMVIGVLGPTLLTLANNIGTGVSEVAFVFTTFNVGVIFGAFLAGFLQRKVHIIYMFALSQVLLGGSLVGIAFSTTLWVLLTLGLIFGLAFGFLDAGCQALILQVLGQKKSRPHIAFYHFLIAVGGAVTPIIVRYFVDENDDVEDLCHNTKNTEFNMTKITTQQYPSVRVHLIYEQIPHKFP